MKLYLGTGGYAHPDWVGLLYPPELPKERWLEVYAQEFNALELNASFYAIPGVRAFAGMLRRSRGQLRFAIKLHRSMTHDRTATSEEYRRLFESVAPLREAGVLGPFLAQFPQSFHRTLEHRRYLQTLVERFTPEVAPSGLAVEFRHSSWHRAEVLESFRTLGLIWVSPDYPALPGLPPPVFGSAPGLPTSAFQVEIRLLGGKGGTKPNAMTTSTGARSS